MSTKYSTKPKRGSLYKKKKRAKPPKKVDKSSDSILLPKDDDEMDIEYEKTDQYDQSQSIDDLGENIDDLTNESTLNKKDEYNDSKMSSSYVSSSVVETADKIFFVCMYIQTKEISGKSEAKIYGTIYPFTFLDKLNNGSFNGSLPDEKSENIEYSYSATKNQHQDILKSAQNFNCVWELELVIGKFTKKRANEFKQMWITKSRGIESRRQRGLEIFKSELNLDASVTCYDKKLIPVSPHIRFWFQISNINLLDNDSKQNIAQCLEHLYDILTTTTQTKTKSFNQDDNDGNNENKRKTQSDSQVGYSYSYTKELPIKLHIPSSNDNNKNADDLFKIEIIKNKNVATKTNKKKKIGDDTIIKILWENSNNDPLTKLSNNLVSQIHHASANQKMIEIQIPCNMYKS